MPNGAEIIDFQNYIRGNLVESPHFDTYAELGNYLESGPSQGFVYTNGGTIKGMVTSRYGTLTPSEYNSTNVVPIRTTQELQVMEDAQGKFYVEGALENGTGKVGSTMSTSIPSAMALTGFMLTAGNYISEEFYDGDINKMPFIIKGNYQFKQFLENEGIINRGSWADRRLKDLYKSDPEKAYEIDMQAREKAEGHMRIDGTYERIYESEIHALLNSYDHTHPYIEGADMVALARFAISAFKLDQPRNQYGEFSVPRYMSCRAQTGTHEITTYNISTSGACFTAVARPDGYTQVHIVSTSMQTIDINWVRSDGVTGTTQVYVNQQTHTKDGHTVYSESFTEILAESACILPMRDYGTDLNYLSDDEALGVFYGTKINEKGVSQKDDDYHLSDETIATIANPNTSTADALIALANDLPFLGDNKITIPQLRRDPSTGDFEKVDLDYYPLSFPMEVLTGASTLVDSPFDVPITNPDKSTQWEVNPDLSKMLELGLGLGTMNMPNFDPDGKKDPLPDPDPTPDPKPDPDPNDNPDPQPEPYNWSLPLVKTPLPEPTDEGETDIPVPPTHTGNVGLGGIYNPTSAELGQINAFLWSDSFWDMVEKMINNPMDAIIGLHEVYFTPSHSASKTEVFCGCQGTGVMSYKVTDRFYTLDCGTIDIPEVLGNVYDYMNEISIYLPYVGIVPLDTESVTRARLQVKYNIDVCSGASVCNIYVTRDTNTVCMYTYGCQVSSIYPLCGRDFTGLVGSLTSLASSIITANPIGIGSSLISTGANMHGQVQKSGGYGGNTGALNIKKPYVIIKKPIIARSDTFNQYIGYPCNEVARLGTLHGYTECENVRLNTLGMDNRDIDEVTSMLRGGVIL